MATVIVCERSGDWAAAWRAALVRSSAIVFTGEELPRVIEARSPADCGDLLAQHPTAVVAIETSWSNLDSVLELLEIIERRYPHSAAVIMAEASLRGPCEFLLREQGAQHVFGSRYELSSVAQMACRHQALRAAHRGGQVQRSLREQIFDRLPWKQHAATLPEGDDRG